MGCWAVGLLGCLAVGLLGLWCFNFDPHPCEGKPQVNQPFLKGRFLFEKLTNEHGSNGMLPWTFPLNIVNTKASKAGFLSSAEVTGQLGFRQSLCLVGEVQTVGSR